MPYKDPNGQQKYRETHREELARKAREHYWNNREKCLEYCKEYRSRPEIKQHIKKYNENHRENHREWYRNHPEKPTEYYKNRILRHPEEEKTQRKNRRENRKFSVMAIYSEGQPRCACCGEMELDFLTIDHINNNGAEHRKKFISGYTLYSWIIKNNFPIDLQVLCMNCQFGRKLNNGVCPHSFNQLIK